MARRYWSKLTTGPEYLADERDLETMDVAGLRLPVRATVAIAVVTVAPLFDYSRTFIPGGLDALGPGPALQRLTQIERFVLLGLVPLAVVIFGFRDRPSRYGLTLGDWRAGAALALVGCAVMTPVVLLFALLPGRARLLRAAQRTGSRPPAQERTRPRRRRVRVPRLPHVHARSGDRPPRRPRRDDAIRLQPPGEARARAPIDARWGPGLRLARRADAVDRLGVHRPHVYILSLVTVAAAQGAAAAAV